MNYLSLLLLVLSITPIVNRTHDVHKKQVSHVPDIEVYDINGKHTTLGALSKNKITVIDSWFIPCQPCFVEMGMLHKLYFEYRSNPDIKFITICRTDTSIVRKFLAKDKSMANDIAWYQLGSKRSDFKLPVYFIPGCNEKIYTGKKSGYRQPDDKTKCPEVQFGFKGYPTLMIFDKKDKLIFKKTGFEKEEESKYAAKLEAIIKSAE